MPESAVDRLARTCDREWPHLANAWTEATEVRALIGRAVETELDRIDSDLDIVVFGSLARYEWTSGSDVDWTLLVDGQASPRHRQYLKKITDCIRAVRHRGKELPDPGQTGTFASITFSHDLIHLIGGDTDTNKNTTRRILLLLESAPVRTGEDQNAAAYGRVVNGVIERYLHNDSNINSPRSAERFPHFLLNDIVRYWRTVCVDFAWKEWEQSPKKWALRNVKRRISRKLLFVSGMLAVFACWQAVQKDDQPATREDLFDRLRETVQTSPLEVTVPILQDLGLAGEATLLLDVYDINPQRN
jgi:predicted nucleotidyltransferase